MNDQGNYQLLASILVLCIIYHIGFVYQRLILPVTAQLSLTLRKPSQVGNESHLLHKNWQEQNRGLHLHINSLPKFRF